MRLCYDLDNTLCKTFESEYEYSVPAPGAALHLRKMKAQGHTIIIQTARGMGRTNGNQGEAIKLLFKFTKNQLAKWGFEYDELYLGKVAADLYIDDKALRVVDYQQAYREVEHFAQGD